MFCVFLSTLYQWSRSISEKWNNNENIFYVVHHVRCVASHSLLLEFKKCSQRNLIVNLSILFYFSFQDKVNQSNWLFTQQKPLWQAIWNHQTWDRMHIAMVLHIRTIHHTDMDRYRRECQWLRYHLDCHMVWTHRLASRKVCGVNICTFYSLLTILIQFIQNSKLNFTKAKNTAKVSVLVCNTLNKPWRLMCLT